MSRLLVACVGNVLRGDDGFGPAVAARLESSLPEGVELVETGIGGIALVQELLAGCDGLVLVDAIDQEAAPGTLFRIEPEVEEAAHVADVHLTNPERVMGIAKAMGALPERVVIVGCQPADVDELGQRLSPQVGAAVERAADAVRETVSAWLRKDERARV
jgi:hydrogenase maturation protease